RGAWQPESCSTEYTRDQRLALQSQVDDLDEAVPVERPLAPVGVEIGDGFGGDGLFQRFPRRLEAPYALRGLGEHVAILREVGLGGEWAVARDDAGLAVREAQQAVSRRDHAVDADAGGAVECGLAA